MPDIKALKSELTTLAAQAKLAYADLETKGDAATAEDRTALDALITAGQIKRADLERAEKMADFSPPAEPSAPQSRESGPVGRKSWGQVVAESKQRAAAVAAGRPEMDRVRMPGALKLGIYSTTQSVSQGVLTPQQYLPEIIEIDRQRPFSILDLVNTQPTSNGSVEYVQMTARTDNTAVVPEYTAGNFGLKPQSDLTFALQVATVKTIPTWIAASRQVLADAPRLAATIDTELMYMVRHALENQILTGDGTGSNFLGITNTSGIQTRVMSATAPTGRGQLTTDTKADTLRRAISDLRLSFYDPDAIVLNPADGEALELLKATTNEYIGIYDPVAMRIWRVRIIETPAIPALTALVGNWQLGATLWDRQETEILTGYPNDFFLRNAVAILAELRAAFAVVRPLAFEKITLI